MEFSKTAKLENQFFNQDQNGRGRFVVLDIEDYEKDRAEKKLLQMGQNG